jgi:hypothetical protein
MFIFLMHFILRNNILYYKLTKSIGMRYPSLTRTHACLKMREHLLTAPGIIVIWVVTHTSTNRAQRCLTLVIKWVPECPTWQDDVQPQIQSILVDI